MRLDYEVITLRTRHVFATSRDARHEHPAVWVRIADGDGVEGWGEADPSSQYGETAETVCAALEIYRDIIASVEDPFAIQEIETACRNDLAGNASARAAISAALHDLIGKRLSQPVYRLWGLDASRAPLTSYTLGLDEPDVVREKAEAAADYPILKVKVGTVRDELTLSAVRDAAPGKMIRVDANGAWTAKTALERIAMLRDFDVELVEQPVPAEDLDGLRLVHLRSPLPVIADESCRASTDIPRLAGAVDGINIKLAKCGGLGAALSMIDVARAHGLVVMLGCMIESSLGIAAAAQLSPLVDYADLDGAALLADDPFEGLSVARGRIHLTLEPGLGVHRR